MYFLGVRVPHLTKWGVPHFNLEYQPIVTLVTLRVRDCFVRSLDRFEQNSDLWVILTEVSSDLNPLASMITSFENLAQTILHYKCELFLDEVHLEGRSKGESQSSKENGNV